MTGAVRSLADRARYYSASAGSLIGKFAWAITTPHHQVISRRLVNLIDGLENAAATAAMQIAAYEASRGRMGDAYELLDRASEHTYNMKPMFNLSLEDRSDIIATGVAKLPRGTLNSVISGIYKRQVESGIEYFLDGYSINEPFYYGLLEAASDIKDAGEIARYGNVELDAARIKGIVASTIQRMFDGAPKLVFGPHLKGVPQSAIILEPDRFYERMKRLNEAALNAAGEQAAAFSGDELLFQLINGYRRVINHFLVFGREEAAKSTKEGDERADFYFSNAARLGQIFLEPRQIMDQGY